MAMWEGAKRSPMDEWKQSKSSAVGEWRDHVNQGPLGVCGHPGTAACPAGTTAAFESCSYSCKAPLVLRPRPGFRSGSNGCGSGFATLSARVLPPRMATCCDAHDGCYDVCGKSKAACDREFMVCLENICAGQTDLLHTALPEICSVAGNALFAAVDLFGCSAYRNSQESACQCSLP